MMPHYLHLYSSPPCIRHLRSPLNADLTQYLPRNVSARPVIIMVSQTDRTERHGDAPSKQCAAERSAGRRV